jgi:epoxyqueuosine reductase
MNPQELAALAKREAAELGFEACGVADLQPSRTRHALDQWLERGFHGEMRYMARQAAVRRDPRHAWRAARSVVVVLHNYYQPQLGGGPAGRIARYAQGQDYHRVMRDKLDRLAAALVAAAGHGRTRVYVDAGPLPERELAQRAGLGWFGKNTMLIHPRLGSFTFIGVILTDLDLATDQPFEADRCGTCRRCLDACPTGAFPAPRVLDATRCVSYLTIEARREVPAELRTGVGDNLFGCDICQDVCPWNVKFARQTPEAQYFPPPDRPFPTLEEILAMDQAGFDACFGDTALERAGLAGLQRNARVVRENVRRGAG